MSEAAAKAFELFQADIGNDEGTGEWFEVTQDQIEPVRRRHPRPPVHPRRPGAGGGHAVRHHDRPRLPHPVDAHPPRRRAPAPAPPDPAKYEGVLMGINYGFNKVRFVSPVKVGSRIRARAVTSNAELKGNMIEVTRNFTIEIEGEEKPALVAEWLTRTVYA